MKRLHVHVAVKDIPQSIGFHSALFAAQPEGESITYGEGTGENTARVAHEKQSACCIPEAAPAKVTSACR